MATTMPSSLEIAQAATLRPILDVADVLGLEHQEVEPYGRYKAKVDLSVIERLTGRPDAKLINVTVTVDLQTRKVTLKANGVSVEMPLARPLKAVTHLGYAVDGAETDFSAIEVSGE